jgi:hypothetical protein
MKWTLFVVGLLVGAAGMFGAMRLMAASRQPFDSNEIVFAEKAFSDSRQVQQDSWVAISGTLTGDGLAHPNNTYTIGCFRDLHECRVASIEQIGPNQIGRMEIPLALPIVKWETQEVVAGDEPSKVECSRATITIERDQGTLLWVEEPVNQTRPSCKRSDAKIAKYTIEDSPGWKRIFDKK